MLITTIGVVAAASWALWLGAPLLDPEYGRVRASDIPLINTDNGIVRSTATSASPSPRSGVVRPAEFAPRLQQIRRKSRPAVVRQRLVASSDAGSASSSSRAKPVTVATRTSGESQERAEVPESQSAQSVEAQPGSD